VIEGNTYTIWDPNSDGRAGLPVPQVGKVLLSIQIHLEVKKKRELTEILTPMNDFRKMNFQKLTTVIKQSNLKVFLSYRLILFSGVMLQ